MLPVTGQTLGRALARGQFRYNRTAMARAGSRPIWRVDRLRHPAVPLLFALDPRDALVYVSLRARIDGLLQHAARHGARLEVERRAGTKARRELVEYLAGRRERFSVAVRPLGTDFQCAVWQALAEIPYGVTCSYLELARHLGDDARARAVGRANATNPIPIVLPCHRVIGSDGELVGFGGGLPTKRWLLQLEQHRTPPQWSPNVPEAVQLGLFA